MEPLPEQVIEAITGEQLAIDLAALTGRAVEEVRQEGVQSTLTGRTVHVRWSARRQTGLAATGARRKLCPPGE